MKIELTKEQSQHLIDLGVPKEKASSELIENVWQIEYDPRPKIFTLIDFLEILPKEIEIPVFYDDLEDPEYYIKHRIAFEWDSNGFGELQYHAFYKEIAFVAGGYLAKFSSDELIDALYKLAVWCIENGHLKFDKSH